MNARHRRVHRVLWPLLTVAVLASVGVAMASRTLPEPMERLPEPLMSLLAPQGECSWRSEAAFHSEASPAPSIRLALYPGVVEMEVLEPIRRPDPLVYLTSEAPQQGALPAGAKLLGLLPESGLQRFALPDPSGERPHLVVFSLADGEVVGWAKLGGQP